LNDHKWKISLKLFFSFIQYGKRPLLCISLDRIQLIIESRLFQLKRSFCNVGQFSVDWKIWSTEKSTFDLMIRSSKIRSSDLHSTILIYCFCSQIWNNVQQSIFRVIILNRNSFKRSKTYTLDEFSGVTRSRSYFQNNT